MVDRYLDEAVGWMGHNDKGKLYVSRIMLRPRVTFADGTQPSEGELDALHHRAHGECYIASTIRAEINIEPKHFVRRHAK